MDGVGIPKNEDFSRGYCSQIAIFTKIEEIPLVIQLKKEKENEKSKEIDKELENIAEILYPFEEKTKKNFVLILRQNYKFFLFIAFFK